MVNNGVWISANGNISLDIKVWFDCSRSLVLKYNLGNYCHINGIEALRSDEITEGVSKKKRRESEMEPVGVPVVRGQGERGRYNENI